MFPANALLPNTVHNESMFFNTLVIQYGVRLFMSAGPVMSCERKSQTTELHVIGNHGRSPATQRTRGKKDEQHSCFSTLDGRYWSSLNVLLPQIECCKLCSWSRLSVGGNQWHISLSERSCATSGHVSPLRVKFSKRLQQWTCIIKSNSVLWCRKSLRSSHLIRWPFSHNSFFICD